MKIVSFAQQESVFRPDGRLIKDLISKDLGMSVHDLKLIYVEHPENFTEKIHYHKEIHEIFFFLDDARYRINGKDYEIKKFDLVVFEPDDIHGGLPTSNKVALFIIQVPANSKDKWFPEVGA